MASQSKSDAARENGKKSRGPVTPQGKQNSSRNALKHGITAESVALSIESEQEFADLLQAHQETYQPANAVEMDLVQSMALARWRLRRIAALESNLFENELALCRKEIDEEFETISDLGRLAFVFQQQTSSLALLIRYESSLTRLHDRTYKHLKELQKLRNEPTKLLKPNEPPCVSMRTETTQSIPSALRIVSEGPRQLPLTPYLDECCGGQAVPTANPAALRSPSQFH